MLVSLEGSGVMMSWLDMLEATWLLTSDSPSDSRLRFEGFILDTKTNSNSLIFFLVINSRGEVNLNANSVMFKSYLHYQKSIRNSRERE